MTNDGKGRRLNCFEAGQGKVGMFGEHGKETSVFVKCRAFLGKLRNFEFLKNSSALWSESVSLFGLVS